MKFAVFIITHGRADRVETYDTLRRCGYTGRIFIVVDNEDTQLSKYLIRFNDVLVFNKQMRINATDTIMSTDIRSSAVFARNTVEHYAKHFGLHAFAVFDDDITSLRYRWIEGSVIKSKSISCNMDSIFELYSDFIIQSDITATSFMDVMFYVNGVQGIDDRICKSRYFYQIYIRNTSHDVEWLGIMNEDHITEIITASRGKFWWALPYITYDAVNMDKLEGGNKSNYEKLSSFKRSFLATVVSPNSCGLRVVKDKFKIKNIPDNCTPKVISSRYKK